MVQFYPDKYLYRGQGTKAKKDSNVQIVDKKMLEIRQLGWRTTPKAAPPATLIPATLNVTNDDVHVFYYGWYANPATDGTWSHWDHPYLPNWDKTDKKSYPTGKHNPATDDIGADFFPEMGSYSSSDRDVITKHFQQIKGAGIGVVVYSWYPPHKADENGLPGADRLVPKLLQVAQELGLKVALHIEPYKGRTTKSLKEDLQYVVDTYADHPAFYKRRVAAKNKSLPVYYIYDSYQIAPTDWKSMLGAGNRDNNNNDNELNVRNTPLDGVFLGLLVDYKHRADIKTGCFDGFYTYFAANGFSYGSSWKNWRSLAKFAHRSGIIFSPSVGPGYSDVQVRPWNGKTSRKRRDGDYYQSAWKSALESTAMTSLSRGGSIISVTSYNEWHEGTQIEPAVPKTNYFDYLPNKPDFYLTLTRKWVNIYTSNVKKSISNVSSKNATAH